MHEGIKDHHCKICDVKFGLSGNLKRHVKLVHEGIKDHQCQFCDKKFGRSEILKRHVKRIHIHDGVDQSQSLKHIKHIDRNQKRSKNVNNSKRMRFLEKEALDVSNIVGFDHENETASKEQKIKKEIKQEIKTEPMYENIIEGIVNFEPIGKNSKKMMEKQALDVSNIIGFDHIEEQKNQKGNQN